MRSSAADPVPKPASFLPEGLTWTHREGGEGTFWRISSKKVSFASCEPDEQSRAITIRSLLHSSISIVNKIWQVTSFQHWWILRRKKEINFSNYETTNYPTWMKYGIEKLLRIPGHDVVKLLKILRHRIIKLLKIRWHRIVKLLKILGCRIVKLRKKNLQSINCTLSNSLLSCKRDVWKKEDSALKCIVTKETKEDDDEAAWSFDPIRGHKTPLSRTRAA